MAGIDVNAPVSRFLEQYSKQYHSGAFATPTAKELAANPRLVHQDTRVGSDRAVVIARRLSRDSVRTDFTGAKFTIPAGAVVATHIGRTPGLLPELDAYDYVMAYAEDRELSAYLEGSGYRVTAARITAAAEIINCWGPVRGRYPAWDQATVTDFGLCVDGDSALRERMVAEVAQVRGWDDDFPYYSDGSWSAVCLKGFWPDEPGRGVKPAEMPRSWKEAHPDDLRRRCDWTVLADQLPALTEWVKTMPWQWETERVRLLRMTPGGKLGRHTDITDRAGGTRDGQIIRFHIPLITHPDTRLITWDLDGVRREQHLAAWHMYYLDARKPHAVVNGPVDRVHLVVDAVSNAALRHRIATSHRRP